MRASRERTLPKRKKGNSQQTTPPPRLRASLASARSRRRLSREQVIAWSVLVVGLVAAYSPTFTNGFVYDDNDLIAGNALVTGHRWADIWQKDLWAETPRLPSMYYRPLVATSFAVEHAIFGTHTVGYHIGNLLLHCIAVILLFFVARHTFGTGKRGQTLALLATFLFAFHPANTQVVYWVAARADMFVTIAVLAGMICVTRPGKLAVGGMLATAFVALFSKETGVLYLLLVPLYGHFFGDPGMKAKRIMTRMLWVSAIVVLYLAVRLSVLPFSIPATSEESFWQPSDGIGVRLLTIPAIWGFYLLRAVVPYFLCFETGIHLFYLPTDWQFIAGIVSILGCGFLMWRFRRNRFVAWASLFWIVSLLPFLNIFVATFESGMEHYLYLPLVAFVILLASLVPERKLTPVVASIVVLSFAVTIFLRGGVWKSDLTLWSDAVAKTSVKSRQGWRRSRGNLAKAHLDLAGRRIDVAQNLRNAETLYREIVNEFPDFGYAWRGLGDVSFERGEFDKAESHYRRAIEYRPYDYIFRNKLGVALLNQGKYAEAKEQYERTLELNPGYPAAVFNLVSILMRERKFREAEELINRMDPSRFARYPNAWAIRVALNSVNERNVAAGPDEMFVAAQFLDYLGLYDEEAKVLGRILAIAPKHPQAKTIEARLQALRGGK